MIGKMKAVGLAAFAIAAMGMVSATVAQAANGQLHVTNTPGKAVLTGGQVVQNILTLTHSGSVVTCEQALFEGTISDGGTGPQTTATEGTLTPQYTGCEFTSPVLSAGEVRMNGCKITVTGGVSVLTATNDIIGCTAGKSIELVGGGCTITIGEQGPLSHVTFANAGSGETQHVTAQITVQGIQYQSEGLLCILGTATRSDGDYAGTLTAKAFTDQGTTTQTTHNGHQFAKLIPGAQRGLFAT